MFPQILVSEFEDNPPVVIPSEPPDLKHLLLFYNLIQGKLKVQRPQVYIEELKHWYIIKNYKSDEFYLLNGH